MNIVIFDGDCLLCSKGASFILKHDVKKQFLFLSMQDNQALSLMQKHKLIDENSIIFVKEEKAYIRSDAVLQLCKNLDGWPYYIHFFMFIPKTLRDYMYTFIARHRYKIFGKRKTCFLDEKISASD